MHVYAERKPKEKKEEQEKRGEKGKTEIDKSVPPFG